MTNSPVKILSFRQALLWLKNIGPVEITDRYGGRPPSWLRGCFGDCEAMGFYPTDDQSEWPLDARALGVPEKDGTPDDGWRFVKCGRCNGTGRVSWLRTFLRIPRWLFRATKNTWELSDPYYDSRNEGRTRRLWRAFKICFVDDLMKLGN